MKRTRDESATPKTKDDGEEEVVNTGEHENDVSGRTSNPASRYTGPNDITQQYS